MAGAAVLETHFLGGVYPGPGHTRIPGTHVSWVCSGPVSTRGPHIRIAGIPGMRETGSGMPCAHHTHVQDILGFPGSWGLADRFWQQPRPKLSRT